MKRIAILASGLLLSIAALAATSPTERTVTLKTASASGEGPELGTVRIVETTYGLAFYPNLKGLTAGQHGFHVHDKGSCAPTEKDGVKTPAGAAGGHYDPKASGKHGEPWGDGHMGDLPALYVAADGTATSPVLAPRLKLADVLKRSIMVHVGGDNHSDHPAPLGGGGARMACGVIGE